MYGLINSSPGKYDSYRKWRKDSARVISNENMLTSIFLAIKKKNDAQGDNETVRRRLSAEARDSRTNSNYDQNTLETVKNTKDSDLNYLVSWNMKKIVFHVRSNSKKARTFNTTRVHRTIKHIPILNSGADILKPGTILGRPRYCIICFSTTKTWKHPKRSGNMSRYQCFL